MAAPSIARSERGPAISALTSVTRGLGWATAVGLALWFVARAAARYFNPDLLGPSGLAPRGLWLRFHIVTGIIALFTGLVQLRTGPRRSHPRLHRALGRVYLIAIALSVVAVTVRLVAYTPRNWMFVSGVTCLAVLWVVTTGLAYAAIRRGLVALHREWMLRSYVTTFAFVSFRVFFDIARALNVGTRQEQTGIAAWFCWAVPLLALEIVLQGRKLFQAPRRDKLSIGSQILSGVSHQQHHG